jgi:hypothetical protein
MDNGLRWLVPKDQSVWSSVEEGMEIGGEALHDGPRKTLGRGEFSNRNGGRQESQTHQQSANVLFGCAPFEGTVFCGRDFLSNQGIEGIPSGQWPRSSPGGWRVEGPSGT